MWAVGPAPGDRRQPSRVRWYAALWLLPATLAAALATEATAITRPKAVARIERPNVHPVAVFGTDDRQAVPPKYAAVAQSIGVLFNNRTRTVCSAFCVSDAIVATAAHCLSRPATGRWSRADDFVFARNHDRIRDMTRVEGFATRSSAQSVLTGDFALRVRPPIDAAHDWALVRLARAACKTHELPVKVLSATELIEESRAGRVFQVSYHRDYAQWRAAYSKPCSIARNFDNAEWSTIGPDFLEAERMILHTCDTGGASSGSPMLIDTPSGAAVIGINVGTYVQSRVVMQNGQMTHRQRAETIANTAVNAVAFADRIETLRRAHILASGALIRSLQERLRARRLYRGRIDGAYGPILRTAIKAYEKANTLPITGLATEGLLLRLRDDRLPSGLQSRHGDPSRAGKARGR